MCFTFGTSDFLLIVFVMHAFLEIEITRDNIEKVHWKEVGHCLTELYKTYEASRELTELATFLTEGEVT